MAPRLGAAHPYFWQTLFLLSFFLVGGRACTVAPRARGVGLQYGLPVGLFARWTICRNPFLVSIHQKGKRIRFHTVLFALNLPVLAVPITYKCIHPLYSIRLNTWQKKEASRRVVIRYYSHEAFARPESLLGNLFGRSALRSSAFTMSCCRLGYPLLCWQ